MLLATAGTMTVRQALESPRRLALLAVVVAAAALGLRRRGGATRQLCPGGA